MRWDLWDQYEMRSIYEINMRSMELGLGWYLGCSKEVSKGEPTTPSQFRYDTKTEPRMTKWGWSWWGWLDLGKIWGTEQRSHPLVWKANKMKSYKNISIKTHLHNKLGQTELLPI